jgi:DEAD/DEAH box helicase domain-containing protein
MSLSQALEDLRHDPRFAKNIAGWRILPARAAVYEPWPENLDGRLLAALKNQGIARPYRHQAVAVRSALDGANVVVSTSAASGKTVSYNAPVLNRLLADPAGRALYLFPTKALAHDQLSNLTRLTGDLAQVSIAVEAYDGDTPANRRTKIRDRAQIVLTNPDMLHGGILPQHVRWAGFFSGLRVVVIDEMHSYRGVFGSHVANVLRRLSRICAFYGSAPQFLLASATIANPRELAERLIEAPVTVVGPEDDGAPRGERHVVLYNPPIVDIDLGIRRSATQEAADLASALLVRNVQHIVFAPGRLTAELMLTSLREQAGNPSEVSAYRSGYLPQERRGIEEGLRRGQLRSVVATTALELGIDIGQLEAAILAGYPGTIASTLQQMGRAGRRAGEALAILVAGSGGIDQYVMTHPGFLFDGNPERGLINPDNPVILAGHLTCAAAELPFADGDTFGLAPNLHEALAALTRVGELFTNNGRYFWGGQGSPAQAISLRTGSADRVIIHRRKGEDSVEVIGELERSAAPMLVHPGAIYWHAGESFLVEELDWEGGAAYVREIDTDYYTRASLNQRVEVLATTASTRITGSEGPVAELAWGEVRVESKANSYRRMRRRTNEVLSLGAIELPAQLLETAGCWLALTPELVADLKDTGEWASDENDYGPAWPRTRDTVRALDSYRCRACGAPELPGRPHHVHHRVPLRAFVADPLLRPGFSVQEAWRAANRLDNLVTLCPACHMKAEAGVRIRSGLPGLAALLANVAPLHMMCDANDLGFVVEPQAVLTGLPTITIYEKIPAGIGFAELLYDLMPGLLDAAEDLATACPCTQGCPACVGPVLEHDYALDAKKLTLSLLAKLIGAAEAGGLLGGRSVI